MEIPRLLDPTRAEVRVEFAIARATVALEIANRATAEQWAAVADTIDEARSHPEVFIAEPTTLGRAECVDFSVRAAAADLAVQLGLSENSVRTPESHVRALRTSMLRLWAEFRDGRIVPSNARTAAELVTTLPDEHDLRDTFDSQLVDAAQRLAPARFRARARALRDRLCAHDLAERAAVARLSRGVWLEDDVDGMAWLSMKMPAADAHRAFASIDSAARSLDAAGDEARSLSQLRADVAVDLLTGAGGSARAGVSVAVTVPVMTLLGRSDEPGTLDGYGPIDARTARELAGHAPSFTRLLVHPVSSAVLDLDRTSYRVPADLKRWLAVRDRTCTFPGCGRAASGSDIDHTVPWHRGGATTAENLAHLCRHHHRLKHQTRWQVKQVPDRRPEWTSPTGHVREGDPPPF
ncbi:MAG: DUF222 domain-containing protein [Pseudolysinimonas sp.]